MVPKLEKRKQSALKLVQQALAKADCMIAQPDSETPVSIHAQIGKLNKHFADYQTQHDQLLESLTEESQYDVELDEGSGWTSKVYDKVTVLEAILNAPSESSNMSWGSQGAGSSTPLNSSGGSGTEHDSVKLPHLHIAQYDGDPLKWTEFWDSFNSTIHGRSKMAGVDKFKYLRSYLTGDAERFIAGYPTTNESYETAVDALRKRFGRPHRVEEAHINALFEMPPASSEPHKMRRVHDECERHIRCLVALGFKEENFGRFFAPVMVAKFPFLREELARSRGEDEWSLEKLRHFIGVEISAKEARTTNGVAFTSDGTGYESDNSQKSTSPQRTQGQRTVSSFTVSTRQELRCVYCGGKHYSDTCRQYPDLMSRMSALGNRCYKCLSGPNHNYENCSPSRPCWHCKEFTHHRSLCPQRFPDHVSNESAPKIQLNLHGTTREPSSTSQNGANSAALFSTTNARQIGYLHTAQASLQGSKERLKVRMLLDAGSTVTFITYDLAERIGANLIGTESMTTAGFESLSPRTQQFKIYKFKLFYPDGSSTDVRAHAMERICCPIMRYAHDVKANPVLGQVALADTVCSQDEFMQVNLLVGGDYYYDIVLDGQLRYPTGLVLLKSKLGYVIGGKVPEARPQATAGCMLTQAHPLNTTIENKHSCGEREKHSERPEKYVQTAKNDPPTKRTQVHAASAERKVYPRAPDTEVEWMKLVKPFVIVTYAIFLLLFITCLYQAAGAAVVNAAVVNSANTDPKESFKAHCQQSNFWSSEQRQIERSLEHWYWKCRHAWIESNGCDPVAQGAASYDIAHSDRAQGAESLGSRKTPVGAHCQLDLWNTCRGEDRMMRILATEQGIQERWSGRSGFGFTEA